ncbi:hypothetical protein F5B19DRAFT_403246 [Rostrohypoxylon terebratum]|nr:hypothetical protein F5B19DRAFT_403246 [Rostrohypoxylon terebratum]
MSHSHSHIESGPETPHAPADFDIDNVKTLSSSMTRPQIQALRSPPGSSGRSSSFAEDREPLLGHSDRRGFNQTGGLSTVKYSRKRKCDCGLPIIVFCRLFNTVFAVCTIVKANKDVGDGWNIRIHRLLFDFCWIIFIWNILALLASIVVWTLFPAPEREKEGSGVGRDFRDKMRVQFACNDAVLGIITLILLVVACRGIDAIWEGELVQLMPPVVAMVASLVTIELLVAIIQPFRYSENMLLSISWASETSQLRAAAT